MSPFFSFIILIFGLAVGSLLNAIIYRINSKESFLLGRSHCPDCLHQLSWKDLFPVFSFIALGGKCRYCKKPISCQYPLVELTTAILFVLILDYEFRIMNYEFLSSIFILNSLFQILVCCFLIIIFVYDLKHYIIPDGAVFSAITIAFLYNFIYSLFIIHNSYFLIQSLISATGAAIFFLVIFLVSKGNWMGFGDVKLAFLMGIFLGYPDIIPALFLAFFIGAIMGVVLIIFKKKKFSSEVPFGPFLVAGTFLALFWGVNLIQWYTNLLTI
ncbi:MAG: prepilin peptidase [Patescibacteria group bacterium]